MFKRVLCQRDESLALQAVAMMQQGEVVELTATLALAAATLAADLRLPTADSIILATARAHDAALWTQDADFEHIGCVRFVRRQ